MRFYSRMQRFGCALCLLVLLPCVMLASQPLKAPSSGASGAVQALLGLLHFNAYQAKFKQWPQSGRAGNITPSEGTVSLARPGRFRWETLTPTHQILWVSGDQLTIYDVDLMQATLQKLPPQGMFNPAVLLSATPKVLASRFIITRVHQAGLDNAFILKPKQRGGQFTAILMGFRHGQLVEMRLTNSMGEPTRFTFSGIKINPALPAGFFHPVFPKDVDIIRNATTG